MDIRNEIRSYIVREGLTLEEVLERLAGRHHWSRSLSNFSGKLKRGSIRCREAKEIAEVLGYEIVWIKRA